MERRPLKIYNVIENKSVLIERDLVFTEEYFDILQNSQEQSFFTVSYKPKGLEITAGNNVGVIPINKNIALNILPKIEVKNFFHLLHKSHRNIKMLDYFMRAYNQSSESINLIELLTISFLKSMETLEQEGIYRDYVRKVNNSSAPKGKILFKENMSVNIFKNINYKVVHSFQELDRDILPNQVIKYTIEYLIQYYRLFERDKKFLRKLNYYREIFSRVSYNRNIRELSSYEIKEIKESIPQIRNYYLEVLEFCFLIINKASFQFEAHQYKNTSTLPSIYINMEDVFEQYLINILKEYEKRKNISIYKGKKRLFSDTLKPNIEPDIILEKDNVVTRIADAKYKGDIPTRDDIFQMISYLDSYKCDVGVFILPRNNNTRIEYLGNLNEKSLYIYRIELNHSKIEDLQNEEVRLYSFITSEINKNDIQQS